MHGAPNLTSIATHLPNVRQDRTGMPDIVPSIGWSDSAPQRPLQDRSAAPGSTPETPAELLEHQQPHPVEQSCPSLSIATVSCCWHAQIQLLAFPAEVRPREEAVVGRN